MIIGYCVRRGPSPGAVNQDLMRGIDVSDGFRLAVVCGQAKAEPGIFHMVNYASVDRWSLVLFSMPKKILG